MGMEQDRSTAAKIRITEKDKERWQLMQAYINELHQQGYRLIAGVDEAGRGPLAGPVVAAACILPLELTLFGLNDSKKMTKKRREALFEQIIDQATAYSIVPVNAQIIDLINIRNATIKAMSAALKNLLPQPDIILTDAMELSGFKQPLKAITQGDAKVNAIAAASILAKVSRDLLLQEYDGRYPGYGFSQHKGYGTIEHFIALDKLGACPIHRLSFLKDKHKAKLIQAKSTGDESAKREVAKHLFGQGFDLEDHSYRVEGLGEIDLICRKEETIYFVQVKSVKNKRKDSSRKQELLEEVEGAKIKSLAHLYLQQQQLSAKKTVYLLALAVLGFSEEVKEINYCPLS